MAIKDSYQFICDEINSLKNAYPSLRDLSDEHIFTILCVKSHFFKNPSISFTEETIKEFFVDSVRDGGVDALLSDPNSETNNLIICQSKFYNTKITFDAVRDAVSKMILFYKSMERGEYETVNSAVLRRFMSLNAEVGEESKVVFVFYTSSPKNSIREDRIRKLLVDHGLDTSSFDIQLYFGDDIVDEIKESKSRRATVEFGKIKIDESDNVLYYGDDAVIVNVSAFSIKELYATHSTALLSKNLRYYIKKRDIDTSVNETIDESPESFWYKNNGITIICDDFSISGKEIKLKNFSVVNGGQTTTLLYKSKGINKENDLFLPCKIIKTIGDNEIEKDLFSLEIAKATNSQKAIKAIDLKANAPEQIRFGNAMRTVGVFYQTKRGETIPKNYREDYKNSDLVDVGKLCLAGIFQLPASSRSKPSSLYSERFYNPIFNCQNQLQVAYIVKELLYIDSYFRKTFISKFDKEYEDFPNASELIPFAHNSRTLCIAFAALMARFYCKNIKTEDIKVIFDHVDMEKAYDDYYYEIFKDLGNMKTLFPAKLFQNKDNYDCILYELFKVIINAGCRHFSIKKSTDSTLTESNFLKRDNNYFLILKSDWFNISSKVKEIFEKMENDFLL